MAKTNAAQAFTNEEIKTLPDGTYSYETIPGASQTEQSLLPKEEGTLLTLPGDVERNPALLEELARPYEDMSSAEGLAMQELQSDAVIPPQVYEIEIDSSKLSFGSSSARHYRPAPEPELKLVPSLMADLGDNFFTYFLGVILCALALFKVYQVQETREVTALLNEVRQENEDLQRQWLLLTSERQTLSEHARIRKEAAEQLQMRAPKTDAELMIAVK